MSLRGLALLLRNEKIIGAGLIALQMLLLYALASVS